MQRLSFSAFTTSRPSDDLRAHLLRWLKTYPQQRIPPVREISQALQISSRDVVSLMGELRQEGIIETRRGSGSWPSGGLPVAAEQADKIRQSPSELAHTLRERIRGGVYATGSALPSAKTLAHEWDRHPQTVGRILDSLVTAGVLEKSGRSWMVPRPRTTKSAHAKHRILLVGASDDSGALRMDSDREVEFWRDISLEASRNGLETSRFPWRSGAIAVPPGTLGLVVSTWHILDVQELLHQTALTRLPVCTWMEGLDGREAPGTADHPRLFVHEVAHSKRAGQDMGQYLSQCGYRRVAWISPFGKASWSRSREEGMTERLDAAGVECASFGIEALSEWDFLAPAWSDPDLWDIISPRKIDDLTDGRSRTVVAKAAEQLGLSRLARAWSASLEEALAWRPDVWVACNDRAALIAKEWLSRKGLSLPGGIAIAGFDDSGEALRQDLTSYRFDTASMSRSMLLQILSWRKDRRGPVRISRHAGSVVVRGSTPGNPRITSR
ncbi:MAG: hypothetical protein RL173_3275 [Fibrobacterota bacterium]|jgi:DNA-binding transcriptional regulator YhcF (GntR family)